jgi:hypothetical protein
MEVLRGSPQYLQENVGILPTSVSDEGATLEISSRVRV